MDDYSDEEFAAKVEWEGGIIETIFVYGLGSDRLANKDGALYKAVVNLEALGPKLLPALDAVERALDDVTDS